MQTEGARTRFRPLVCLSMLFCLFWENNPNVCQFLSRELQPCCFICKSWGAIGEENGKWRSCGMVFERTTVLRRGCGFLLLRKYYKADKSLIQFQWEKRHLKLKEMPVPLLFPWKAPGVSPRKFFLHGPQASSGGSPGSGKEAAAYPYSWLPSWAGFWQADWPTTMYCSQLCGSGPWPQTQLLIFAPYLNASFEFSLCITNPLLRCKSRFL